MDAAASVMGGIAWSKAVRHTVDFLNEFSIAIHLHKLRQQVVADNHDIILKGHKG